MTVKLATMQEAAIRLEVAMRLVGLEVQTNHSNAPPRQVGGCALVATMLTQGWRVVLHDQPIPPDGECEDESVVDLARYRERHRTP